MKSLILSLLLLSPLAGPSAAQDWALDGYDPVGYASGRVTPGRSDITTIWQGKIWHFASEENRARFEADPRSFAPGFGGLCLQALSEGRRIAGDPRHFVVIGNQVYLLRSDSAEREMLRAPRQMLMQARESWASLR